MSFLEEFFKRFRENLPGLVRRQAKARAELSKAVALQKTGAPEPVKKEALKRAVAKNLAAQEALRKAVVKAAAKAAPAKYAEDSLTAFVNTVQKEQGMPPQLARWHQVLAKKALERATKGAPVVVETKTGRFEVTDKGDLAVAHYLQEVQKHKLAPKGWLARAYGIAFGVRRIPRLVPPGDISRYETAYEQAYDEALVPLALEGML